jgi:hypothetical protein
MTYWLTNWSPSWNVSQEISKNKAFNIFQNLKQTCFICKVLQNLNLTIADQKDKNYLEKINIKLILLLASDGTTWMYIRCSYWLMKLKALYCVCKHTILCKGIVNLILTIWPDLEKRVTDLSFCQWQTINVKVLQNLCTTPYRQVIIQKACNTVTPVDEVSVFLCHRCAVWNLWWVLNLFL